MNMLGGKRTRGFTVVELLVVIAIIATLATITLIAYNGMQARTYDASVQTDLADNSKVLTNYYADNGSFPTEAQLASISPKLKFVKANYGTSVNAVLYCRTADGSKMALIVESKSGKAFYVSDTAHVAKDFTASFPNGVSTDCPGAGISSADPTTSNWLHTTAAGWDAWVQ